MKRLTSGALIVGCAMIAMTGFSSSMVSAQDEPARYIDVWTTYVKAGAVPDYIELQVQLKEAMMADGRPGRSVWQEIRGDRLAFHSVTEVQEFGQNDAPFEPPFEGDEWNDWVAAITETVDHSTRSILRRYNGLSIAPAEGSEPNLLYLRYRTVAAGKGGDYHDWLANSLTPALRAGGATGVTFNRITLGGNNRTFISGTALADWAEMDGEGPLSHMSEEDAAAMISVGNDMVVESENRLLRYRADLSY